MTQQPRWCRDNAPFKCPICGDVRIDLRGHLNSHHVKLTIKEVQDIMMKAYQGKLSVKK